MGEVSGIVAGSFWGVTCGGGGCAELKKSRGMTSPSSARRFERQYSGLCLKYEHIR